MKLEIIEIESVPTREGIAGLFPRSDVFDPHLQERVRSLIQQVAEGGDKALVELTLRFDQVDLSETGIAVSPEELSEAPSRLDEEIKNSIDLAIARVRGFHQKELVESWSVNEPGMMMGERVLPLSSAGCYVPGGNAAYPSSAVMSVVPAKVAGVEEVVMCSPPRPDGSIAPAVLYAAQASGCGKVFRIGGVQAVAAMALGTESVPRVDKIVGPGNIYVAAAKRELYGRVGIDSIAGPSEVLIIADPSGADAEYIAYDLLAQAEHGSGATSYLIATERKLAEEVVAVLEKVAAEAEGGEDWKSRVGIMVSSIEIAAAICNEVAPEHLELMVSSPLEVMEKIRNAGTILLGRNAPAALTDYMAGPNHILPTGGAARFQSPLGVADFTKRTAVVMAEKSALERLGRPIMTLAESEGLEMHAQAVKSRLSKKKEY